mgnify:CR=1 FL=1
MSTYVSIRQYLGRSLVGYLKGSLVGYLKGSLVGYLKGSLVGYLKGSLVGYLGRSLVGYLGGSLICHSSHHGNPSIPTTFPQSRCFPHQGKWFSRAKQVESGLGKQAMEKKALSQSHEGAFADP